MTFSRSQRPEWRETFKAIFDLKPKYIFRFTIRNRNYSDRRNKTKQEMKVSHPKLSHVTNSNILESSWNSSKSFKSSRNRLSPPRMIPRFKSVPMLFSRSIKLLFEISKLNPTLSQTVTASITVPLHAPIRISKMKSYFVSIIRASPYRYNDFANSVEWQEPQLLAHTSIIAVQYAWDEACLPEDCYFYISYYFIILFCFEVHGFATVAISIPIVLLLFIPSLRSILVTFEYHWRDETPMFAYECFENVTKSSEGKVTRHRNSKFPFETNWDWNNRSWGIRSAGITMTQIIVT